MTSYQMQPNQQTTNFHNIDTSLVGSIQLTRVHGLTPYQLERCKTAQIHTMKLDMHMSEVIELMRLVASHSLAKSRTALEILQDGDQMSDYRLDATAKSTKLNRGVTELVGPAGLGKTQWCFTAAATAYLPVADGGLGGGTFWFDTEGAFSSERLIEIAQRRYPDHFKDRKSVTDFLGSVKYVQLSGLQDPHKKLLQHLQHLEIELIQAKSKLIIVDGIAATVRSQEGTDRQTVLSSIAGQLKLLSETCGVSVLVTNQVTTQFMKDVANKQGAAAGARSDAHLVAALGTGWAHAVNTRFLLESRAPASGIGPPIRLLKVAKSPMFDTEAFVYEIDEKGATIVQTAPTGLVTGSVLNMQMHNTNHMTVGTRK